MTALEKIIAHSDNSPLSTEQRQTIVSHIYQVNTLLNPIIEGIKENNLVVNPDYLTPTVRYGNYSLKDPKSEFMYYWKIRSALETALFLGHIPAKHRIRRAPPEIEALTEGGKDTIE